MEIQFDNDVLKTQFLGMSLSSPIIVGSGPLTDSLGRIKKYFNKGAGAVIGKTIYIGKEEDLVEKVHVSEHGLFNSTTYSKKSVENWLEILNALNQEELNVIPSLHAETPEMLGHLAAQISTTHCKMVELGIACPNDGSQQKITANLIHDYTKFVKQKLNKPIIVKLATTDGYLDYINAALEAGASAISLSDTLPAIVYDVHERKYIFDGPSGLSGPAIKPIVLHAIYQARRQGVICPIIGIGGIETADDVLEYLHVGANVVQIYTALMQKPASLLSKINTELSAWCIRHDEKIANFS